MKRIISLLIVLSLMCVTTGCSGRNSNDSSNNNENENINDTIQGTDTDDDNVDFFITDFEGGNNKMVDTENENDYLISDMVDIGTGCDVNLEFFDNICEEDVLSVWYYEEHPPFNLIRLSDIKKYELICKLAVLSDVAEIDDFEDEEEGDPDYIVILMRDGRVVTIAILDNLQIGTSKFYKIRDSAFIKNLRIICQQGEKD